jgi:hypothetical protein
MVMLCLLLEPAAFIAAKCENIGMERVWTIQQLRNVSSAQTFVSPDNLLTCETHFHS